MKKFFAVYAECVRVSVASAMVYRANFFLTNFIYLLSNIFFPLVTILIYNAGASFPGWTFWEVLLIQGIYTLSRGVNGVVAGGIFWRTSSCIQEGSYELVLLKPINPLFFLISSTFSFESISVIFGGLFMIILSVVNIGGVSLLAVGQFILLFFSGVAVMLGSTLIMSATSFKWVGNSRIPEIFESIENFGKYPISIFPEAIQFIASFIIPVGMIGFFPASALLGKADIAMFIAVIPCFLYMLLGVWLYGRMIKLYEGVGG